MRRSRCGTIASLMSLAANRRMVSKSAGANKQPRTAVTGAGLENSGRSTYRSHTSRCSRLGLTSGKLLICSRKQSAAGNVDRMRR